MSDHPRSPLGRYEIRESLGKGGMGEVYRAFDPRLEREVALKLIPEEIAAKPASLARFEREAKALAALRHPGVVTVFSVEESDGVHFLTMELIEGTTLVEQIAADGMELARFRDLALRLTDTLAAVHQLGIVHRDLKPSNVMVDRSGAVTLLDFGLVKRLPLAEAAEGDATLTLEERTTLGTVMGTRRYMSPE